MSKITAYSPLTQALIDDVLPIVDIHDTTMAPSGTTKTVTVQEMGQATTGLRALTGGGVVTPAMVLAAQAAGIQGFALNPRNVWDFTTFNCDGLRNFLFTMAAIGSIGWGGNVSYATTGYIKTDTGGAADGIQFYASNPSGNPTQGLIFRNCVIVGANSRAPVHWGGGARECGLVDCLVVNTLAFSTTVAAGSNGAAVTSFTGTQPLSVAAVPSAPSGTVLVAASGGPAIFTYSGTSAGQLNNVTLVSGSGTLATGGRVDLMTFAALNDTALSDNNSENNILSFTGGGGLAGAFCDLGIGIGNQTQSVNDTWYYGLRTSGAGQYDIVKTNGGNHRFKEWYSRGNAKVASVWNHGGGRMVFEGGEHQNSAGLSHIVDGTSTQTIIDTATVTQAGTQTQTASVASGSLIFRGACGFNNAQTIAVSGSAVLDLSDPATDARNVTVTGTSGTVMLASGYQGKGNPPVLTSWTGAFGFQAGVIPMAAFGANGNGTADNNPALQNALNAALTAATTTPAPVSGSFTLEFGAGNFLLSAPVQPKSSVRIKGVGAGSRLFTNSAGIFDFNNNYLVNVEIDHLTLDATGGWIFNNINLHRISLHDLVLIQRSGNYGFATLAATGGLSAADIDRVTQSVYSDAVSGLRSVPGWSLIDGAGSGKNLDVIAFRKVSSFNMANASGSFDNTQYIFDIACTVAGAGGLADRVTFEEPDFGNCLGGGIRLRSVQGARIEQPGFGNTYNQGTPTHSIGNSLIYIGQYPGAAASMSPVIAGYVRENSGTQTFGTFSDIEVDAATVNATIISPVGTGAATNPPIKINVNGSAGAVIVSPPSGYTLLNPAGDTTEVGNGTVKLGGVNSIISLGGAPSNGFQVENFDQAMASAGGAMVNGTIYVMRWDVLRQITLTNLWYWVTGAAISPTTGQNWIGVYNSAGTRLAQAGIDGALTANAQNATIAATTLAPGIYDVLMVTNCSGVPSLLKSPAALAQYNINTATATLRAAVAGTTQTILPATSTPSGYTSTNAFPFWVAGS